jgi:hypothetical protein
MSTSRKTGGTWQVLNQKTGRSAKIGLPSGEEIVISIGTADAKIFAKRGVFGWFLPRVIVSKRLSVWRSDYRQYNGFHRRLCRGMVLEGLLASLSHCRSIDEIQRAWQTMQNPVAVTGMAMMKISQRSDLKDGT